MTFAERTQVYVTDSKPIIAPYDQPTGLLCKKGNNFVSDRHVCNTFCPVLLKLVDV